MKNAKLKIKKRTVNGVTIRLNFAFLIFNF